MNAPNEHRAGWTDDRVALLRKRWAAGRSASEIARELGGGVTRLGVIGKVHRLGLEGRATPASFVSQNGTTYARRQAIAPEVRKAPANPRGRKPGPHLKPAEVFGAGYVPSTTSEEVRKRSEASAAAGRKLVSAFAEPANDDAVLLINRRPFQCSWPVGDPVRPAAQLCCGQPVPEDANRAVPTYCAAHAARAISRSMLGSKPDPKAYERSLRRVAYA
jgi:GcrA cell cycle regulator